MAAKSRHLDLPSLLHLLDTTNGRDKFAKLMQYGSRLVAWYLVNYVPTQKETAGQLTKLEKGTANARKLFRLLRPLAFGMKALETLSKPKITVTDLLSSSSAVGFANYFFADHFVWFIRIGFLKGDEQFWVKWSFWGWLMALVFALSNDVLELIRHIQKTQAIQASTPQTEVVAVEAQRKKLALNFTKNIADLIIALTGTKLATFGDATLGVCGVVAASVGTYEAWPLK
jgi:peroxin-11B